jgi:DNA-binding NtrC family response regulator
MRHNINHLTIFFAESSQATRNYRRKTMTQTDETSYSTIRHVLIVDDEIEFVKALERHLKRQNFTLETAFDGLEAMELMPHMAQEEGPFDLVVSDVVMPCMDGIQLLEEIKQHHPTTSVLLLTGFGENTIATDAIRKEMDDFHQKPITPQEMLTLIKKIDRKRAKALTVEGSGFQIGSIHPKKKYVSRNYSPIPRAKEENI